jgi:hypothetical protein
VDARAVRVLRAQDRVEVSGESLAEAAEMAEVCLVCTLPPWAHHAILAHAVIKPAPMSGYRLVSLAPAHNSASLARWWAHTQTIRVRIDSCTDVRTQGQYQYMDPKFVGLIFSVFPDKSHNQGRVCVCAFQSLEVRACQWN